MHTQILPFGLRISLFVFFFGTNVSIPSFLLTFSTFFTSQLSWLKKIVSLFLSSTVLRFNSYLWKTSVILSLIDLIGLIEEILLSFICLSRVESTCYNITAVAWRHSVEFWRSSLRCVFGLLSCHINYLRILAFLVLHISSWF